MAKRRFQTKYDVAEDSRLLGDELDYKSEMTPDHWSYDDEEDYCDWTSSPFDFWEQQIAEARHFIWWVSESIDQLIKWETIEVLSGLHDQVSRLFREWEGMIDNEGVWTLVWIELMLRSTLQLRGGCSNTMLEASYKEMKIERRLQHLDELKPPIRAKLTSKKNELPDGVIMDPRDDRTSWKRGLVRTRFGIMRVKDACELDMAEHLFDRCNQWGYFEHLPRIRVRKAWMVRNGRKRRTWSSPSAKMSWQEMDFFLSEASRREDREDLEAKVSRIVSCCERIMPGMTPQEASDYDIEYWDDYRVRSYESDIFPEPEETADIPEHILRCFSSREIENTRQRYPRISDLVDCLERVMSQAM